MSDVTSTIQDQYTLGTVRQRVFDWLSQTGIDPDNMTCDQLYPLDQMHGRGIGSTRQHAEHAAIRPGAHVLDLGCGIGGASRFLAAERGCRLTAIDLTQEFIDLAIELTERCGLADRVEHLQGDATDLPFEDAHFDHVWCHNVTMNIEDKAGLAREVARVLKPGGRFSCTEVGLGPGGSPLFPLPWAAEESLSFLVTPHELAEIVEAAGLRVVEQVDMTDVIIAFRKEERERAARGETPMRANHIVMGDDFPERARNMAANSEAERVVEHIIVAEKIAHAR